MYLLAGREQEALAFWLKAIDLYPNHSGLRFFISIFLLVNERFEEAEKQLASLGREEVGEPLNKFLLGYLYAKTGKKSEALKLIDELKLFAMKGLPQRITWHLCTQVSKTKKSSSSGWTEP